MPTRWTRFSNAVAYYFLAREGAVTSEYFNGFSVDGRKKKKTSTTNYEKPKYIYTITNSYEIISFLGL